MAVRGYSGRQLAWFIVGVLLLASIVGGWYTMSSGGTSEVAAVFVIVVASYALGWKHGTTDRQT